MINITDTIVAPATNISIQAIALIRMSGSESFDIINKLLKLKIKKEKNVFVRNLYDKDKLVDQVIITSFINPNSFTGEDTVEIACHGGILNTRRIINLLVKNGARMALKGEFSQRAFVNNKIDLIQSEGINNMIHAKNDLALDISINNMSGLNNKKILDFKKTLLDLISKLQVLIDYPEFDDIEGTSDSDIMRELNILKTEINNLLTRSKIAFKNVNGIKTSIIGKTNVGKSSLLNSLINEDKAIVTNIEGTTRDIVEGQINLDNISLNLIDTAGFRKTSDIIENLGIEKSKELIQKSDLILFVVTQEDMDSEENKNIIKLLKDKNYILIFNKTDTLDSEKLNELKNTYKNAVFISAINGDINQLIEKIKLLFNNNLISSSEDLILISINQILIIEKIVDKIENALIAFNNNLPIDIVIIDLQNAWNELNNLIGIEFDEEIINNIFRKYCLGK